MKQLSHVGLALALLFLSACGNDATTDTPAEATPNTQEVTDDTVGVSLTAPKDWVVKHDEFTDGTYGFVLAERNEGDDFHPFHPKLRVALVEDATPEQIGELVEEKRAEYAELELNQTEVEVGGAMGVAVSGLPAPEGQYTVVYVGVEGRVYHVGVWQELGAEAQRLFDKLEFTPPVQSLKTLNLPDLETYLKARGMPEVGDEVELDYSRTDGAPLAEASWEGDEPDVTLEAQVARGCALQPRGLRWQTQWIDDASYYSNRPGWSRMGTSTNGFFNDPKYHLGCKSNPPRTYGQFYAVDYGLQVGAKLYSAIPGRVKYAGQSNDNYWSLGIFVDVRTTVGGNAYTNRSAHLSRLNVRKGKFISKKNLPYVVIGRAGLTGYSGYPHLHTAVFKNASVDRYGRAYNGTSVKPRKMRCFGCNSNQYDTGAKGKGGFYTNFYRQRWLKW